MCGFTVMASAAHVLVNVDLKTRNYPVTLTVQNADVSDVLSALFTATNNTYQLQTGLGITGTIDALQLTQTPFDDAVKAILAKANPAFTFSKQDGGIYFITNTGSTDTVTPVPTLYMPVISDNSMVTMKATLPYIDPSKYITATDANGKDKNANDKTDKGGGKNGASPASASTSGGGGGSEDSLLGDTSGSSPDAATKEAATPTNEECFVAMIQIHNQPVHVFSVGFGADELPDFSTLANPQGANGSGSSGFGYGGMNGMSGYGMNSPYGSAYGSSYGSAYGSPYGSSYPYGTSSPYGYGTSSPYGYGTSSPYGYGTSSPYGYSTVSTVGTTSGTSTSGGR
jgi:hypothetical protein